MPVAGSNITIPVPNVGNCGIVRYPGLNSNNKYTPISTTYLGTSDGSTTSGKMVPVIGNVNGYYNIIGYVPAGTYSDGTPDYADIGEYLFGINSDATQNPLVPTFFDNKYSYNWNFSAVINGTGYYGNSQLYTRWAIGGGGGYLTNIPPAQCLATNPFPPPPTTTIQLWEPVQRTYTNQYNNVVTVQPDVVRGINSGQGEFCYRSKATGLLKPLTMAGLFDVKGFTFQSVQYADSIAEWSWQNFSVPVVNQVRAEIRLYHDHGNGGYISPVAIPPINLDLGSAHIKFGVQLSDGSRHTVIDQTANSEKWNPTDLGGYGYKNAMTDYLIFDPTFGIEDSTFDFDATTPTWYEITFPNGYKYSSDDAKFKQYNGFWENYPMLNVSVSGTSDYQQITTPPINNGKINISSQSGTSATLIFTIDWVFPSEVGGRCIDGHGILHTFEPVRPYQNESVFSYMNYSNPDPLAEGMAYPNYTIYHSYYNNPTVQNNDNSYLLQWFPKTASGMSDGKMLDYSLNPFGYVTSVSAHCSKKTNLISVIYGDLFNPTIKFTNSIGEGSTMVSDTTGTPNLPSFIRYQKDWTVPDTLKFEDNSDIVGWFPNCVRHPYQDETVYLIYSDFPEPDTSRNMQIHFCVSENGGKTFSEMNIAVPESDTFFTGKPAITITPQGNLMLIYGRNHKLYCVASMNGGFDWSEERLVRGGTVGNRIPSPMYYNDTFGMIEHNGVRGLNPIVPDGTADYLRLDACATSSHTLVSVYAADQTYTMSILSANQIEAFGNTLILATPDMGLTWQEVWWGVGRTYTNGSIISAPQTDRLYLGSGYIFYDQTFQTAPSGRLPF